MDNKKKLELTLCGMLPYGLLLNLKTDNQSYLLKGIEYIRGKLSLTAISSICVEAKIEDWKPLLHSLDKLTEAVLDGGLIPMVELAKMSTEKNTAEIYEDSEIISIRIANKSHYLLRFCYSKKNNDFYKTINGAKIPCKNQIELFEKLKEWHFNVYDLPKEMYIEKSESNGTT